MYPLNRRLSLKNCYDRFCCTVNALLLHGLTHAYTRLTCRRKQRTPPSRICGDLHSKASSVVLPVTPPIKTDSLDSASSLRMATFSVLARSSDAVSTLTFECSVYNSTPVFIDFMTLAIQPLVYRNSDDFIKFKDAFQLIHALSPFLHSTNTTSSRRKSWMLLMMSPVTRQAG